MGAARLLQWALIGACFACVPPKLQHAARAPVQNLESSRAPEPASPSWLSAARAWPALSVPLPSQHLGEPHLFEIRVSPAARSGYLELTADTRFESGTWFVQWLRNARTGRKGPVFALERANHGWRFWVLQPTGQVQAAGELHACAGCHAAAPAAPVFGLPHPREAALTKHQSPD